MKRFFLRDSESSGTRIPEKRRQALNINDIDTVFLSDDEKEVVIIDQTLLPVELKLESINKLSDMERAIKRLEVRGAPAIGVFAALSIYVLGRQLESESLEEAKKELFSDIERLNATRPTAVNLSWALKKMRRVIESTDSLDELVPSLKKAALKIYEEDIDCCRKIGEYGVSLIKDGDGILTHCNAGKLATVRYGTATAPMYLAREKGMNIKVYCDETRPLLQGARLTAFELSSAGIDTTLQCDNMSASLMKKGLINAVFVGCDRVAANGDTANKIGTSMAALAARRYKVPFYVAAPTSTIDMDTPSGDEIIIEQRDPSEVTDLWYEKRMAPQGISVYNPAFDVTDNDLISGIVTEYGIARPPFNESLKEIMERKEKCQK